MLRNHTINVGFKNIKTENTTLSFFLKGVVISYVFYSFDSGQIKYYYGTTVKIWFGFIFLP